MIPRSAAEGQEVNSRSTDEVFTEHGYSLPTTNAHQCRCSRQSPSRNTALDVLKIPM